MFTFVVDNGSGLTHANSFVDVDEADAIITEDLASGDSWLALEPGGKVRAGFATRTPDNAMH